MNQFLSVKRNIWTTLASDAIRQHMNCVSKGCTKLPGVGVGAGGWGLEWWWSGRREQERWETEVRGKSCLVSTPCSKLLVSHTFRIKISNTAL